MKRDATRSQNSALPTSPSFARLIAAFLVAVVVGSADAARAVVFQFTPVGNLTTLQTTNPALADNVLNGFLDAGQLWSDLLTDDITVNINVNFAPLGVGVLGSAGASFFTPTYSATALALTGDIVSPDDATAVANLPATPSLVMLREDRSGTRILDNDGSANNNVLDANTANGKALGLVLPHDIASDASITFSSNFGWDFQRSNGINPGQFDFVAVAGHEIGHALGFISGVDGVDVFTGNGPNANFDVNGGDPGIGTLDPFAIYSVLDLYRYSIASVNAAGQVLEGGAQAAGFFSLDQGATNLGNFATGVFNGDGAQASHWKDNQGLGLMDPTLAPGALVNLSALDVRALDVIGYDLSTAGSNDSVLTLGSATPVDFGRVMAGVVPQDVNVTINKTGVEATTYSVAAHPELSVSALGTFAGGAQSEDITLGLAASSLLGLRRRRVAIDNTATNSAAAGQGSLDPSESFNTTIVVVDDRVINTTDVGFGSVFVGANVSDSTTLTSTQGNNQATQVNVLGTAVAADVNGIGIDAGAAQLFNTSGLSLIRQLSGSFSTAGNKSGSLDFNAQGEGLTGESLNDVEVDYTAVALEHGTGSFLDTGDPDNPQSSLTIDFGTRQIGETVDPIDFGIFNLLNTLDFTAGIEFDAPSESGDFGILTTTLSGIGQTSLAADNSLDFEANFDTSAAGVFEAVYVLDLSDQTGIFGAGDLADLTLTLQGIVAAQSGSNVIPEPGSMAVWSVAWAAIAMLTRRRRGKR